jgi:hypothetical protein
MGTVMVNENSDAVESVEEMVGQFSAQLIGKIPVWKQAVDDKPEDFAQLEQDVHVAYARGADLLVAGLLAVAMKPDDFQAACEQTRQNFDQPLARGRNRTIRIRLLGGLVVWVASLYCDPKKGCLRKSGEKIKGVYVELAQFGFGKGVSPGLQSRVARQAALCPSLELARQELERGGVKLDVKAVRRVAYQCGEDLLRLRRHQVLLHREGKLPAGDELHGKRVTVQIDGGRTKLRGSLQPAAATAEPTDDEGLVIQEAPGRSRKRARQTFDAQWREPKLLTIFVHDEQGRMVKQSQATIDGTFEGPDAVAELAAMHLHRLGAARAESITFAADGAPWIWDRIAGIVERAKLGEVPVYEVLDCCHAAHHISLALAALGLKEQERMPLYRQHRTLLRNGQWRRVVEELTELSSEESEESGVWTEIGYLQKHGKAGRLRYTYFRGRGIPIGSGAIESSIRRVINLRLKSNGIFWRRAHAETMLQLRSQVISNRWDTRLAEVRTFNRHDSRPDWHCTPQTMTIPEAETTTAL